MNCQLTKTDLNILTQNFTDIILNISLNKTGS